MEIAELGWKGTRPRSRKPVMPSSDESDEIHAFAWVIATPAASSYLPRVLPLVLRYDRYLFVNIIRGRQCAIRVTSTSENDCVDSLGRSVPPFGERLRLCWKDFDCCTFDTGYDTSRRPPPPQFPCLPQAFLQGLPPAAPKTKCRGKFWDTWQKLLWYIQWPSSVQEALSFCICSKAWDVHGRRNKQFLMGLTLETSHTCTVPRSVVKLEERASRYSAAECHVGHINHPALGESYTTRGLCACLLLRLLGIVDWGTHLARPSPGRAEPSCRGGHFPPRTCVMLSEEGTDLTGADNWHLFLLLIA